MKYNKDSLKARANNISKELNVPQDVIYNCFFFDAFLSRLAISDYKNKLILKGGLYLSSLLGINMRSTIDIDFFAKAISLEEKRIISVIKEICSIEIDDGISFEIINSRKIRKEDVYGGLQISVVGKLQNIRQRFEIDVATGDPIVPSEKQYDYQCLVSKETLSLRAYSLESVIAEKLQTVLSRQITNSRSKDFYDLYILRITQIGNVDISILKQAFKETCEYRNYSISKEDALSLIEEIHNNSFINERWDTYTKIVKYAAYIPLDMVIRSIKKWIDDALD